MIMLLPSQTIDTLPHLMRYGFDLHRNIYGLTLRQSSKMGGGLNTLMACLLNKTGLSI